MSKSNWKVGNFNLKLYKKLYFYNSNFKIWSRSTVVPQILIGRRVLIHNGNSFKKIMLFREKVGFKFGNFSSTRKQGSKYLKKKSKKKK